MLSPFKILAILVLVFVLEIFLFNIIKPNLPKLPGDIYISRSGIKLYIPFVSTLILSVLVTIFFNAITSLIIH